MIQKIKKAIIAKSVTLLLSSIINLNMLQINPFKNRYVQLLHNANMFLLNFLCLTHNISIFVLKIMHFVLYTFVNVEKY